jgi:hypothetical protein
MKNSDALGDARLDATASFPFEDHDNGMSQSSCPRQSANPLHERPGGSWSIPPPAVRT